MDLLRWFRRPPPIRELDELASFIDEHAAFLVQKGIYDYARARSGPYSKSLLAEPDFHVTINRSRWRAYPLGLAMVGEMAEGVLRPHAGGERRVILDPLTSLVLEVFDRYPVPQELGSGVWTGAREELALALDRIGTHPPKRVIDIPEQYVKRYFAMMPFDKELLTKDEPTTLAYLRLTLTDMRDKLVDRMDAADMAGKLRRG